MLKRESVSHGHLKKNYPDKKKGQEESKDEKKADAAVAEEGYESVDVCMVSSSTLYHEWVLDSGCTFHMCPIEHWFQNLKKYDGG